MPLNGQGIALPARRPQMARRPRNRWRAPAKKRDAGGKANKRRFGRSRSPKREDAARWLLANLLDWHRRESKADWWEYFRLKDLTAEDLLDERGAVSGLVFVGRLREGKIPTDRYSFEKQETNIREGDTVCETGEKVGITATSTKLVALPGSGRGKNTSKRWRFFSPMRPDKYRWPMLLAVSQAAKNVVLLGDPQQMEQPVKGSHPNGAAGFGS